MVELLLEYGANINAQDESGYTLLMMTVNHYASNDILCLLLDKKADLYLKDNRGMTAFDHAREKNRSEVLIMFEAAEGKR
ncbi:ankyrin [Aspergillus ellipticus CBS 707.79]|uniref:Ankyrin n=1 Tax=Aspergillus ellipticus CBS 707.79 TaxID=1448320 RepID=A0A319CY84_9EURO|nr:ankyrin [Aspergillus ellipticus CBS 707.79]